jgi:uncharacterized membrane protein YedE/YeeE
MTRAQQNLAAFVAGAVFGAGLLLSRMSDPRKVLAFLNVFGAWDASLIFVMVGAIGVYALAYRVIRRRDRPLFAPAFSVPERRAIDARLLLGAACFGVGWGLSGYCPGPALLGLSSLGAGVSVFVLAMAIGMFASARLEHWRARTQSETPDSG